MEPEKVIRKRSPFIETLWALLAGIPWCLALACILLVQRARFLDAVGSGMSRGDSALGTAIADLQDALLFRTGSDEPAIMFSGVCWAIWAVVLLLMLFCGARGGLLVRLFTVVLSLLAMVLAIAGTILF